MPGGPGRPTAGLSKSDLWSTILVFPGLGLGGLVISAAPGLIIPTNVPTLDARIARAFIGAILWLVAWWCTEGRSQQLSRRGFWVPFRAGSHLWRA